MSTPRGESAARGRDPRPAEQRAEALMERVAGDVSRFLGRFAGRAREELEDIVAEARTVRSGWNGTKRQ